MRQWNAVWGEDAVHGDANARIALPQLWQHSEPSKT